MLTQIALSTLIMLAPSATPPAGRQMIPPAAPPARQTTARPSTPTDETEAAAALFAEGRRRYERGSYDEALKAFDDLVETYRGGELADLAVLWVGRCELKLGNTVRARVVVMKLRKMNSAEFADLLHAEIMRAVLAEVERRRAGGGKD